MDAARYARQGYVDVRQHGRDAGYIGLWETAEAAVERAARKHDHVDKETHVILEIEFTPHGIAHFTTMCQGVDGQFQSTLFKKKPIWMSPRIGEGCICGKSSTAHSRCMGHCLYWLSLDGGSISLL